MHNGPLPTPRTTSYTTNHSLPHGLLLTPRTTPCTTDHSLHHGPLQAPRNTPYTTDHSLHHGPLPTLTNRRIFHQIHAIFFFDICHFESFHLFPSSTLSVSPHLLLFINSSIRLRPRSSYPSSLFPSVNHGTLILLLLAGDVELNPGPSPLNFTHLNIRSIRSFQKSSSLHNYLADHPTDILSLNETWLQPTDSDNFVSSLAPPGYSILHSPRLTGQGGGLGLIISIVPWNSNFSASRNLPPPESFELMATKLSTGNKETIFLNIYRPPSSKMSTFLDEFQNLLEIFVPSPI